MSHTIELKDEVFQRLKQTADKIGLTPEGWIEEKVKESSNTHVTKQSQAISEEERKELHRFHKRMEEKFDEIMKEKARTEGLKTW